ncbi:MAG: D-aminoacyl-tRNA deacylase [bacterium]|nr:D-aminoacyl-tRNA deacylase [bacterium]
MRIVVQRVREALVSVGGRRVAAIGPGYLLLVGVGEEDLADGGAAVEAMAAKVANLRVMADGEGRMNRSILDVGGAILAVSQFTLHADCRRGRRPSFTRAAPPEAARPLMDRFVALLRAMGLEVQTGEFGAMMDVALVNDGPVTIWLDSREALAAAPPGPAAGQGIA